MKSYKFLFLISMILIVPILISLAFVSSGSDVRHENMMLIHPASWLTVFFVFGIPTLILSIVLFFTKDDFKYKKRVKSLPFSLPLVSVCILFISSQAPQLGTTVEIIATVGMFLTIIIAPILFILGFIVIWIDKNA
jgi:hypothetical protein